MTIKLYEGQFGSIEDRVYCHVHPALQYERGMSVGWRGGCIDNLDPHWLRIGILDGRAARQLDDAGFVGPVKPGASAALAERLARSSTPAPR